MQTGNRDARYVMLHNSEPTTTSLLSRKYSSVDLQPRRRGQSNHFFVNIQDASPYPFSIDCFTHALSFLGGKDKILAALTCRAWKKLVYSPQLWPILDLSSYSSVVHNLLLEHILNKYAVRFTELRVLRLEGCSALRSSCLKIITENCPDLEVLLLTGCSQIHQKAVIAALPFLPKLQKIELFGVTEDYSVAEFLKKKYPWLDLGMFWLQYLASIGKEDQFMIMNGGHGARARYLREVQFPDEEEKLSVDVADENFEFYEIEEKADTVEAIMVPPLASRDFPFGKIMPEIRDRFEEGPPEPVTAPCRYAGGFVGGCWGQLSGRVVFSNQFYPRGGNYPREVLYSCYEHRDEDFKDEELEWCRACERFTREGSFFGEMTCKVCFDEKNLQNREIWVPLTAAGIKSFNFNHVLAHTLTIADRRNLPTTLKNYGNANFTLDLTFEDEEVEDMDLSEAPVKAFWNANSQKIRLQVHALKKRLDKAKKKNETRALLLYRGSTCVEIHADKGLLFDGSDGQDYINLTIQAWGEFYNILGPILGTLLAVLLFLNQIISFTDGLPIVRSNPISLPDRPQKSSSWEQYIIVGFIGVLVVIVMALRFLSRFRALFERMFRSFLVADIFLILAIGAGVLAMVSADNLNISTDIISMALAALNFGIVGLLAFYKPVPEAMHRIFLVTLFGLMAIILGSVLGWWTLVFIIVFAGTDVFAMVRPRFAAHFSPFLLPTNLQVPNTNPKIFYEINGLRLRATDFLFYGLMAVFTTDSIVKATVGYTGILFGCALCVYVLPFFSKKIRPLPVSFLLLLLSLFLTDQILNPYLIDSSIKWTLMHP